MAEAIIITTDKSKIDFDKVSAFIQQSYWGKGRTREDIRHAFDHSHCFSAFIDSEQVGFARVATDYTYHAYIYDVFVFEEFRNKGISRKLLEAILADEELARLPGFMLTTRDAHGLYAKYGFTALEEPDRYMVFRRA